MTTGASPIMPISEYCALQSRPDGKPLTPSAAYHQIQRLPSDCFFRIGRRIFLRRERVLALFSGATA